MTPAKKPIAAEASVYNKTFWTVLGSVMATALIGTFVFLWKINGEMVENRIRDDERSKRVDEIKNSVETIKLDVRIIKEQDVQVLKERIIRIEEAIKEKEQKK